MRPACTLLSLAILAGAAGPGCESGKAGPDAAGPLLWYPTCGDPVCDGHRPHPGVPACTTQVQGQACDTAGLECDPGNDCNSLLLCADKDPRTGPGGCPISRRAAKQDVRYLGPEEVDRLSTSLLSVRLATWRWLGTGADSTRHLGFLIDDQPESPAVDSRRDTVDLYGYISMAVAAIQAQDARIRALDASIDALRWTCEPPGAQGAAPAAASSR